MFEICRRMIESQLDEQWAATTALWRQRTINHKLAHTRRRRHFTRFPFSTNFVSFILRIYSAIFLVLFILSRFVPKMQLFSHFLVSCMRTHESANSVFGAQTGGIIIGEFNCWHWTNGLITRGQMKMFTRAKSNAHTQNRKLKRRRIEYANNCAGNRLTIENNSHNQRQASSLCRRRCSTL